MLFIAQCDIKKGQEFYVCDKCDTHTPEPHTFKDDEFVYCKECYDYALDMGDMAAEAAMEQEQERKADELER